MNRFLNQTKDNGMARIVINRPEAMNALDVNVLKELNEIFNVLDNDPEVKVVILTGVEKSFVAGADIAAMSKMSPEEAEAFSRFGQSVFDFIENMKPVTIAAVNGYALGGGCELAMACDIRVAAETAKIAIPETSLGVFPGFAGTQRLSRLVGLGIAKEMLATAEMITAQRAYEIGLVNHVVKKENLVSFCEELAGKIMKNCKKSIAIGKHLMNVGKEMAFDKAEAYEAALFGVIFSTIDQKEGMRAFLEKRSPKF